MAKFTKTDLKDLDYNINGNEIVEAKIEHLMFKGFTQVVSEAQSRATDLRTLRKFINSIQMAKCVTLVSKKGEEFPLDETVMLTLPVKVGKRLLTALSADENPAGSIVVEGDGITKSVIYKLGTPIQSSSETISELEFHAKLYSDIEDVLAEDMPQEQTLVLINKVAKPIGTSLQALPSWAVDQITVADGMFISTKILPGFLE